MSEIDRIQALAEARADLDAARREAAELRAENEKLKAKIDALETEANRCEFCDKPGVIMHREKMCCQYHYENGGE